MSRLTVQSWLLGSLVLFTNISAAVAGFRPRLPEPRQTRTATYVDELLNKHDCWLEVRDLESRQMNERIKLVAQDFNERGEATYQNSSGVNRSLALKFMRINDRTYLATLQGSKNFHTDYGPTTKAFQDPQSLSLEIGMGDEHMRFNTIQFNVHVFCN